MAVKINLSSQDRNQLLDMVRGFFVYGIGDLIAQIILGQTSITRTVGIGLIGSTVYALEIPLWFRIIENTFCRASDKIRACRLFKEPNQNNQCLLNYKGRTLMALSYFNPLWIARHMFFIGLLNAISNGTLFSSPFHIYLSLLGIAWKSFIINIPITIIGNYIVQNKLSMKYRLTGSAVLSSICAIWYALSKVIFKG
ncbi:MAG: hypothetical protein KGZ86_03680 [Candidatus Latescibacteria bacterium]|nr:hypothetical protein [Candidatus Latescibacterota bacterium]